MQSKTHSIIEQLFNVGSGYLLSLVVWILVVAPLFDIETAFTENLAITSIFTVVSIVRGYFWRRLFNRFSTKRGVV